MLRRSQRNCFPFHPPNSTHHHPAYSGCVILIPTLKLRGRAAGYACLWYAALAVLAGFLALSFVHWLGVVFALLCLAVAVSCVVKGVNILKYTD